MTGAQAIIKCLQEEGVDRRGEIRDLLDAHIAGHRPGLLRDPGHELVMVADALETSMVPESLVDFGCG